MTPPFYPNILKYEKDITILSHIVFLIWLIKDKQGINKVYLISGGDL